MTGSYLPTLMDKDLRIESIGNYKLTGSVLGKGHFARVEEAIHMLLNVKVLDLKYFFITGKLL